MEGKKLLESSTLTHTSEEPEAQAWAKIGTTKYASPPKQGKDSAADGAGGLRGGNAAEQTEFSDEQAASDQQEVVSSQVKEEEEGNTLELHVDSSAEPIQRGASAGANSGSASGDDKTATPEEKSRKKCLGDGFEELGEADQGQTKTNLHGRNRSQNGSRPRDRSRSHERHMSRGSDGRPWPIREFTSSLDERKIKSRVFVGHLAGPKDTDTEFLRKAFSEYGKITGVNLQKGYGFVQFDNQESAVAAIKGMNQTKLLGETIGKRLRVVNSLVGTGYIR